MSIFHIWAITQTETFFGHGFFNLHFLPETRISSTITQLIVIFSVISDHVPRYAPAMLHAINLEKNKVFVYISFKTPWIKSDVSNLSLLRRKLKKRNILFELVKNDAWTNYLWNRKSKLCFYSYKNMPQFFPTFSLFESIKQSVNDYDGNWSFKSYLNRENIIIYLIDTMHSNLHPSKE